MNQEFQSAYQEEQQQLEKTAAEIERQYNQLNSIPNYVGEDLTEQALEDVREKTRKSLRLAREEPYFGRLDFHEEGNSEAKPLYIGKTGVADEFSGVPLVIDWRAPVASMFYSFTGGGDFAFYQSPEGLVEGAILLKRNIVIRKQLLQRVVDTYVAGSDDPSVSDEFLLYRLGENKDHKLRDIVSTIQSEQNDIIRSPKNIPLIIQGAAGSGKTTVALHRLAYLIYEFRENLNAENMIIFAPNRMFLDYISNVLPELGVGGIQQTTFEEWALDLLDDQVRLKPEGGQYSRWFAIGDERPDDSELSKEKFKGSIRFLHLIEEALEDYEQQSVPSGDFKPWEGRQLPIEKIKKWYEDQKGQSPAKRRERVMSRIKSWIHSEVKKIPERHLQSEYRKKANQRLRSYFKSWPEHTPLTFYQNLFKQKSLRNRIPESIAETVIQNLRSKEMEKADLAPLVFIQQMLQGIDKKMKFHHVVIDEAQDFSPFQLAVLKERTSGDSFSILGDLSQAIYSYTGIQEWGDFQNLFGKKTGYFQLEKSYRSTMEIIHFANEVLKAGTEPIHLAEPVFRSGEEVKMVECSETSQIEKMAHTLKQLNEQNVESIGIIGRTEEDCRILYDELTRCGHDLSFIHSGQRTYGGGLSVLPVYLAKGLEFDAVLLMDTDAKHYEQTELDAKLLYVGCTRALHELWLFYSGECSPLLKSVNEQLYTMIGS